MAGIEIRRATEGDLNGVVGTTAGLFAEDGAARDPLRDPEWPGRHGAAWVFELSNNPNALLLVAVTEGAVVGHLVALFQPASAMWRGAQAELMSMYVAPHLRGRGVGSGLVERFTAWARERGATRAHVAAYTANEAALRFYRRQGYVPLTMVLATDL